MFRASTSRFGCTLLLSVNSKERPCVPGRPGSAVAGSPLRWARSEPLNLMGDAMNRYVLAARSALATAAAATAVLSLTTAASAVTHRSRAADPKPSACAAADLGVWLAVDEGSGAAGSIYYPLQFTNLGRHACLLRGFAGVVAVSKAGKQLGRAASRDHVTPVKTVLVAAGGTAHATLRYSDVVVGDCRASRRVPAFQLRVTPPSARRSAHAQFGLDVCTAQGSAFMSVTAIKPGPGTMNG